ncbi:hypothetical protein SAMN05216480_101372 [Pustulibacterium marinum]|uniref:Uncharacterized protein n=1 Tax=Pustulibacterium marinum TaxID=1224947 RepID=A0A1I7EX59_9FLAO|nr:hypothetical protein [Pustulibacterium marinum]SFU28501.1 hypothetical protein SAMN05216480_101372 [Pustulibacterium marinum]
MKTSYYQTLFKKVLRFTGVISMIVAMVFAYRPMFTGDGKQYSNLVFILLGLSSVFLALGSNREFSIVNSLLSKFPAIYSKAKSVIVIVYAIAVIMVLVMGIVGVFSSTQNSFTSIGTGFLIFGLGGLVMLNNMLVSKD